MRSFLNVWIVCAVTLVVCAGCQRQPQSKTHPATPSVPEIGNTAKVPVSTVKAEPKKSETFGFSVTNIMIETCCSDAPGKPTPTGQFSVEGLTPDNVRFMLSCLDYADRFSTSWTISKTVKGHFYQPHTASISQETYGDRMHINNYDGQPPDWKEFTACTIDGRLDDAKNESFVVVRSSTASNWKDGSGYEVRANDGTEMMTLRCALGKDSPCVSVAPGQYRAIRNDSAVRLCDSDLTVISTYQIIDERFLH